MADTSGGRGLLYRALADGIIERYGMDPQIKLFQTAFITDNATGAVLLPDAAEQPEAR